MTLVVSYVAFMIAFLYYISYNINMENYQLESKIKNVTYGRGYMYSLQYHIVWVTKYRKPILVSEIEKEVKEYLLKTLKSLDMDPIAMEIMPDHIHLLVDCKPQLRLSDAIKILKGNVARWLFLEHPEIKQQLWGGHLWNQVILLSQSVNEACSRSRHTLKNKKSDRKELPIWRYFLLIL